MVVLSVAKKIDQKISSELQRAFLIPKQSFLKSMSSPSDFFDKLVPFQVELGSVLCPALKLRGNILRSRQTHDFD